MAGVARTSQFLGFDDGDFRGEDLTHSPPRHQRNVDSIPLPPAEISDSIPLAAHEGDASFNSMSFDSEVGYGEKVADYTEELQKLERMAVGNAPDMGTSSFENGQVTPVVSPKKLSAISEEFMSPSNCVDISSDTFKAYDVEKLLTPKQSKTEFEYNDAHSPVSASKFIERSLHDLDGLINQRRLELSELKRVNKEKLGGMQEFSNPLHHVRSTGKLHSPLTTTSGGSPNPLASPSITIPRATYDGIRDGERSASHSLKAEQAKVKRLEILLQEMEAQSKIHSDRLKSVTAEKMRLAVDAALRSEEAVSLAGEVQQLREELQDKNSSIAELEDAVDSLEAELQKGHARKNESFESPSPQSSEKQDGARSTNGHSHRDENRNENEVGNGNGRSDGNTNLSGEKNGVDSSFNPDDAENSARRFSDLAAEAAALKAKCEETEACNAQLSEKLELLEEARRVVEDEKSNANLVAFQWQGEAKLLESDLLAVQEECNEVKRKAEEAELLVCSKDEKIGSLVLMLQEALEREKEKEKEKDEMRKCLSEAKERESVETPIKISADNADITTPTSSMPPTASSSNITPSKDIDKDTDRDTDKDAGNIPGIDDSDSFWSNERTTNDVLTTKDPGSTKTGASSSLAKRVLITWDRTQGGKGRVKVVKSSGSVSYTAFLMMLAMLQLVIWFLVLLASYFYFADFKSCTLERFRYTS